VLATAESKCEDFGTVCKHFKDSCHVSDDARKYCPDTGFPMMAKTAKISMNARKTRQFARVAARRTTPATTWQGTTSAAGTIARTTLRGKTGSWATRAVVKTTIYLEEFVGKTPTRNRHQTSCRSLPELWEGPQPPRGVGHGWLVAMVTFLLEFYCKHDFKYKLLLLFLLQIKFNKSFFKQNVHSNRLESLKNLSFVNKIMLLDF